MSGHSSSKAPSMFEIDGQIIPIQPVDHERSRWDFRFTLTDDEAKAELIRRIQASMGDPESIIDATDLVRNAEFANRGQGWAAFYGLSLSSPNYNQAHYFNRGGAVIGLCAEIEDEWHVAVLEQRRPLQDRDKPIVEFPRGQASMESGIQTAARQLVEETGLEIEPDRFIYLGSGNPDNALILGQTVHIWMVELMQEELVRDADGVWRIRADLNKMEEKSRLWENILGTRLIPFDQFTSASFMTSGPFSEMRKRLEQNTRESAVSGDVTA